MRKTSETFTTMAIGGFVGLGAAFAVTLGAAPADVKDTPPVISNMAAKQDRRDSAEARPVVRRDLAEPVLVRQVQIQGSGSDAVVTLVDAEGRIVFRSDPAARETMVTRDAVIPAIGTGAVAEAHARIAGLPEAVRAARTDPEGFLGSVLRERR